MECGWLGGRPRRLDQESNRGFLQTVSFVEAKRSTFGFGAFGYSETPSKWQVALNRIHTHAANRGYEQMVRLIEAKRSTF